MCAVQPTDTVTAEVAEAVARYEQALRSNDLDVLDELFLDSPATVRADATGVLVGHAAISAFRRGRGGAPAREVVALHVVPVSGDAATAVAQTLRPDGTRGLQTQTWVRTPAGWRVAAAHVSSDVRSTVAGATWRVHGTPLVRGSGSGPLAGVRVAVKDLFAVAGHATGGGNPVYLAEQAPQPAHAPVVAALLAAGADVTGIAQTDEFAYSLAGRNVHSGSPVNPVAPGRLTGGSSSGPAAAVAAGQADLGLGTDTAGSIRVPAGHTGLFSLRPTHGAVDDGGLLPLAPSFDTVGFLTGDAQLLDRVAALLLPDAPVPTRVLLATDLLGLAEAGTADVLRAAAARWDPEEVELTTPAEREEWFAGFRTQQAAEAWAVHGDWVTEHPGALADDVAGRFAAAAQVTPDQHAAAREVVAAMRAALRDRVPPGTVVLMPAASGPAPFVGAGGASVESSRAATLRLTSLASGAGLPAVVVPAGRVDGAPVGLCLLGGAGADRGLTALAAS
ncbi:AtzH-like domain-containing protein [Modestobacter sp. Leaf380]|uniref:AtzH-like domain-containing protein n=1 Tax=Modestobacter sp. Leaf380 TaxID=1736356 RepID=UPI000701102E|nr:amidase [Modestobacter sp. Leaf380]